MREINPNNGKQQCFSTIADGTRLCNKNGCFDLTIDGFRYQTCDTHRDQAKFKKGKVGKYVGQTQIIDHLDPQSSTRARMEEAMRSLGAVKASEVRSTVSPGPITEAYINKENHSSTDERVFTIAGTGTRSIWGDKETMRTLHIKLVTMIKGAVEKHGKVIVISGCAKGYDYVLARAAKEAGAELHLHIPSPTYLDYYWGIEGKEREWVNSIADEASVVRTICENHMYGRANYVRNQTMVDECDILWVFNPNNTSGTRQCTDYANKKGVRMHTVTI